MCQRQKRAESGGKRRASPREAAYPGQIHPGFLAFVNTSLSRTARPRVLLRALRSRTKRPYPFPAASREKGPKVAAGRGKRTRIFLSWR